MIPAATPAKKPLQVFPSPNIRRPSRKCLPPSIGVPPPTKAATGLGTYAGIMIQSADRSGTRKESGLIANLPLSVINSRYKH